MNEQETIDGIKGEWKTVTKPEEVTVGQPTRYEQVNTGRKVGYESKAVVIDMDIDNQRSTALFNGMYNNIQAFFPLPVKPAKRKVAKVRLQSTKDGVTCWMFSITSVSLCKWYQTKRNAIRGAKRFCKAIGYECEIVK